MAKFAVVKQISKVIIHIAILLTIGYLLVTRQAVIINIPDIGRMFKVEE